ncbi:hypothetical protein ABEP13_09005 [Geobacillus stearothermophilus]|uniref:hypothetical protein n=1 Tax=Anoxybacillaceae TaxID=3120669 RepID=UPI000B92F754|nr:MULTISPECIES: hypothetical protein [unclassified Geobacillus]ASS88271.1 hypothetical protein GLN3_15395 [Geobacillus lituanicus]
MKLNKNLKTIAMSLGIGLTLLAGANVYAATKTGTLTYKDLEARYKLDVDWNWFDNDNAVAETKFVNPKSGYKVAVRLEMWKNGKMQGYKYQEDKKWAQVTYSWTGVDVYQSRHSINDVSTNKELVVRSLRDD